MTIRAYFFVSFMVLSLVFSGYSGAQGILLRHQFEPGAKGYVNTRVQMKGNSLINGTDAPTDMTINMLREINTEKVGSDGAADLKVDVMRMATNGKIGDSKFNEDLKDEALTKTMFNQTSMQMQVSP